MEEADIKRFVRESATDILYRISQDYGELVINTLNKAFDRNDSPDGELIILSGHSFSVKADEKRVYECRLTDTVPSGIALCLVERESGGTDEARARLIFDELVIDMGRVALIRPRDGRPVSEKARCIIDTPGGSVKFAIPHVRIAYKNREIMEKLSSWVSSE